MTLANLWIELSQRLGVEPTLADTVWRDIEAAYGEPHRYYHTLDHIAAVVADWQRLRDGFETPDSALLALFFHDIVYDPARQDNEAMSAGLLREWLQDEVDARVIKHACYCIWQTKHHQATGDADTDLVLDIDMAILGAPWDAYLRYAENVAREYIPVYGLDAYAAGRSAVFIEPTLAHDRLFLTEAFAGLETQARENLSAERDLWQSGAFAERLKSAL